MLDALVPIDGAETDPDSPMDLAEPPPPPANPFHRQQDPIEAALEAKEAHKYLLAKSYFDTREYDRCAAVFLPPTIPAVPLSSVSPNPKSRTSLTPQKGKNKASPFVTSKGNVIAKNPYPRLSQKSLFLALYAKYLAGEKRKEEETEMVLGPADGGMSVNRELPDLARGLEGWFAERREQGLEGRGQGWLEYLYGVILLKGKNEDEAKKWLIRSVHLFPFHWGAWQELNDLLSNVEDVSLA
jgi:anaphase-promoting complex subunit 8